MNKTIQNRPEVLTQFDDVCQRILSVASPTPTGERQLIAIAGPPASGKSTLLSEIVRWLHERSNPDEIAGIPMDGFHLDNVQLDRAGIRAVKGAPHTFDVLGLRSLLSRLHAGEYPVYAPEFDRSGDLSRNCAIKIDQTHNTVLIEGNYLLLDQPIWCELAKYFALTIAIDVPTDVLHDRLVSRWLSYGLSEEEARSRALGNDIPNASTVVEQSIAADIVYQPRNHE